MATKAQKFYRQEMVKSAKGEGGLVVRNTSRDAMKVDHEDSPTNDIAFLLDNSSILKRIQKNIEKLTKSKDVRGFFQDISPDLALQMAVLAMGSDNDKIKLEALKDLLDRSGHTKVTRHAVARFSATDSKEAIIANIMGNKKDLEKVGIEIVDDDEDIEETT